MFLSRDYWLIIATQKSDVLTTKYYPQPTIILYIPRQKHYNCTLNNIFLLLLFSTKTSSMNCHFESFLYRTVHLLTLAKQQAIIFYKEQSKQLIFIPKVSVLFENYILTVFAASKYYNIWDFLPEENYLNNRVFLSRNYQLIVAPRKFDVLQTNMLVLRTSNFQGATITDSSET